MTKRKISLLLSAIMIVSLMFCNVCLVSAAEGPYSGGTGTAGDPYLISTADDFLAIPDGATAVYKVTADITLPADYQPKTFAGTLTAGTAADIKTITVAINSETDRAGLFSTLSGEGKIEFLTLKGTVAGTNFVGGFAGVAEGTSQLRACANLTNVTGHTYVGGLVGALYSKSEEAVKECYSVGRIVGGNYVGGIVGASRFIESTIIACYNSGRVIATGIDGDGTYFDADKIYCGGITSGGMSGVTNTGVTIKHSYNIGEAFGGRDINCIYSFAGCGDTAGVEVTSKASVTKCVVANDYATIYPEVKSGSKAYTLANLKKPAEVIKESSTTGGLSYTYYTMGTGGYPYPILINNPHSSEYSFASSAQTVQLASVTAVGGDKSVVISWTDAADPNHDMVEIRMSNGLETHLSKEGVKIIARVSADEHQYVVTGLDPLTKYTFDVYALNDYKNVRAAAAISGVCASGRQEPKRVTATTTEAVSEEITFVEEATYAFTGKDDFVTDEIEGGYSIVVTKFAVPASVTEYTYGMLLSEEAGDFNETNASAIAPADKNKGGAFGILFYGTKFEDGKTYYVRPYVKVDETYTLGEITNFVFSAE